MRWIAVVLMAGCGSSAAPLAQDLATANSDILQAAQDLAAGVDLVAAADLSSADLAPLTDLWLAPDLVPPRDMSPAADLVPASDLLCATQVCSASVPCVDTVLTCVNGVCRGLAGAPCNGCNRLCYTGAGGYCGGDGKCH